MSESSVMRGIRQLIKKSKGETLSETLVAILIIGVVSGGFASLIRVSTNLNRQSSDSDAALYNQITDVEQCSNDTDGKVVFSMGEYSGDVKVKYYSSDDGLMYSYDSADD